MTVTIELTRPAAHARIVLCFVVSCEKVGLTCNRKQNKELIMNDPSIQPSKIC